MAVWDELKSTNLLYWVMGNLGSQEYWSKKGTKYDKWTNNNFCDSQKALRAIEHLCLYKKNRFLKGSIYEKAKKLKSNKYLITIWWIPNHLGLVDNKKANKVAKNRTEKEGQ